MLLRHQSWRLRGEAVWQRIYQWLDSRHYNKYNTRWVHFHCFIVDNYNNSPSMFGFCLYPRNCLGLQRHTNRRRRNILILSKSLPASFCVVIVEKMVAANLNGVGPWLETVTTHSCYHLLLTCGPSEFCGIGESTSRSETDSLSSQSWHIHPSHRNFHPLSFSFFPVYLYP